MLFLHVTTGMKGGRYDDLLREKGGYGFPYLVFMDATGDVLLEHEGPRTVAGFRETGARAAALR